MEAKRKSPATKSPAGRKCCLMAWGLTIIYVLLSFFHGYTQQPASVAPNSRPLSEVLQEFSSTRNVRFAFDAVSFKEIDADFSIENTTTEQLLKLLRNKHRIESKQIDGTWLLIIQSETAKLPEIDAEHPNLLFSGFVKDAETGEALMYCNVAAEGFRGGMTNELGYFAFSIPQNDSVKVLVSHLGYHRIDTVIPFHSQVNFFLKPAAIIMEAIKVVHHERDVLQASPKPEKIAFNPAKASAIPRIVQDDMGNALLLIPGIDFRQGGTSGLSIRGGEPTDNLVLLDGIPVLETSHLLGNMSVLNAKYVRQAFVSRGGFDASHGGRVSGLIELVGKSGKNDKPYLDVSANLMNLNVLANLPVTDKFSLTAAWRRSYIDTWQNYMYYKIIDNVISTEDNPVTSSIVPVVKFQDLNAKISFHPAENFTADFNVLYGTDLQSRDFEILNVQDFYRNEFLDSKNMGLSINLNWQANSRWFHTFSAGMSSLEKTETDETGELQTFTETIPGPGKGKGGGKGLAKTREVTYTRETHDIDNGFNQLEEFRTSWKTQFRSGAFTSEAGAGWTSNKYAYRFFASRLYDALVIDSIASNARMNLLNAFVQQTIDLTPSVLFRWGLRANYDPARNAIYWQPRGGIEFQAQKELKFYFLSGVYYQFLSGIRRFDSEGQYNRLWFLPDQNGAGVVSGRHYIFGGKFEKRGWFIDLEAYHKKASGKMNLFAQTFQQGENQVVRYSSRESTERHRGLDLFAQKKHSVFNHMAGYTFSRSYERIDGFFKDNWFPGYNDRTHRLTLTEMVNWHSWTFTGTWQFGSGLPVYRFIPNQEVEDFFRSDNFSQVNVAVVKNFVNGIFSLSTGATLLNVFNRQNVVEVNYLRFSSDSGSMTIRSDVSALGITPVFFMNIKF